VSLGLLVLRVVVGILFVGHGTQKLFGWFGGHGVDGTGAFFENLGLPPGRQMAVAAGLAEAAGGALLALGLLTPLAAAGLTSVMLTAIWSAHRQQGLWATEGGYEYNLVLMAALFALAAVGPGDWSLDQALNISAAGSGWALAQLGAGIGGAVVLVAFGRTWARHDPGHPQPVG
jgi:putative oxidoreductase